MEDTKRTDPPRIAPSPFDSPNKADFILCTSDNVHFHVYKTFLIVASQFFCNLFSDGTPNEYHDNLPFYRVVEPSSTMAVVLGLCYPVNINIIDLFDSGELDEPVLSALDKYIMDGPLTRLRRELVSTPALTTQKPFLAFGFARRIGCDDVARNAARRFLDQVPFMEMPLKVDELKMISAYELGLLLQYRHSCGQAAVGTIAVRHESGSYPILTAGPALAAAHVPIWSSEKCKTCSDACDLKILHDGRKLCWAHDWFHSFLKDVVPMLRDNPRKRLAVDFIDNALFRVHPNCPDQNVAGIKAVLQALDEDIQSAVDKGYKYRRES